MSQQFDLVCQLGSQVKFVPDENGGHHELAEHTDMRTRASVCIIKMGIAPRLIVLGGSNFGVRYDDDKIFSAQHPTQKTSVFTFEAFANSEAFGHKSEAAVIKEVMVAKYSIQSSKIFAETLSATTEENAEFLAIILRRRPMFTGNEKIGILTLLYHMERAFPIFKKAGLNVEPVFAENILAMSDDPTGPMPCGNIEQICRYYSTPKGGKQYPVERLRHLLSRGISVEELMGKSYWTMMVKTSYEGIAMQSGRIIVCADDMNGASEKIRKISLEWEDGSYVPTYAPLYGPFDTEAEAIAVKI